MKIRTVVAALALSVIAVSPAPAREVMFETVVPQFGCKQAADMAAIKQIGELHGLAPAEFTNAKMVQLAQTKIASGECFMVPAGVSGLADSEWQDQALDQNIMRVWIMRGGPFLYTSGNGWKPISVRPN